MSLDGFIAEPDDREGQELGRDGGRLFNWLDDRMSDGPSGQVFCELMATGAVISGRRTFELAGRWQGDHHDGVPIFVLTHRIDDGKVPPGSVQFVTDVEACAAAGRATRRDGNPSRAGPTRRRATSVRLAWSRPHRTRIGPAAGGTGCNASPIPGASPLGRTRPAIPAATRTTSGPVLVLTHEPPVHPPDPDEIVVHIAPVLLARVSDDHGFLRSALQSAGRVSAGDTPGRCLNSVARGCMT